MNKSRWIHFAYEFQLSSGATGFGDCWFEQLKYEPITPQYLKVMKDIATGKCVSNSEGGRRNKLPPDASVVIISWQRFEADGNGEDSGCA